MFFGMHHGAGIGPAIWLHFALTGLFWLALMGLIITAVVVLRRRPQYPAVVPPQQSPLDILNARYARGEIDAATYQEMRARILAGDPPPTHL